jgi:putative PIN family toxin of toxin-antitoxin system
LTVVSTVAAARVLPTRPLRVVFDTNVLLSLWVFDKRPGGSRFSMLRQAIETGTLLALSRADCLDEFARVLGYPEFQLTVPEQQLILAEYRTHAVLIPPVLATAQVLPKCRDRDDQKFLELARDAQADILTSSDKALLKLARRPQLAGMFRILPPEQLLESLENSIGSGL